MIVAAFLADDRTVLCDRLRLPLEAQGDIKVVGDAANGREAVHQVAQLRPDIVVRKLGISDLPGLVRFAIRNGLIPLE